MAIDVSKFLPYQIRVYPLYNEVVVPLINWVLDSTKEQFEYITDKYTRFEQLNKSVAEELIHELGYGYLLENINLNSEDIRVIFGYLKLFHILKGRKDGLRFVIELLGYDYEEYEWFQSSETGQTLTRNQLLGLDPMPTGETISTDPYTFKVALNLIEGNIDFDKLFKFSSFTRHYVYDILKLFFNISFELANISYTMAGWIDQDYSTDFVFATSYAYMAGWIDQDFSTYSEPSEYVLELSFIDDNSNTLLDLSSNNNNALIDAQAPYNSNTVLNLSFNFESSILDDISNNDNDAEILDI